MGKLGWHRTRRLFASGSPLLFGGSATILAALTPWLVASLTRSSNDRAIPVPEVLWGLTAGVLVGAVLLLVQMYSEYCRRTYDPNWAKRFDDLFNSESMLKTRALAAASLRDNAAQLSHSSFVDSNIEDVLDFLEDLAFYMRGDQITPEVVHHSYHHWIRGYYWTARDYLTAKQLERPCTWEFVS